MEHEQSYNDAVEAMEEPEEVEVPMESRISRMLSEKVIKIVIILVLSLLFLPPIISVETWQEPYLMHENALDLLVDVYDSGDSWVAFKTILTGYQEQDLDSNVYPLILLSVPDPNG